MWNTCPLCGHFVEVDENRYAPEMCNDCSYWLKTKANGEERQMLVDWYVPVDRDSFTELYNLRSLYK